MIVAFRRHALLPLDDCLYALRRSIPHLMRSALFNHRRLLEPIANVPPAEAEEQSYSSASNINMAA